MRLLLDTNVAVFLLLDERRKFSPTVLEALAEEAHTVSLSAVCFLEIAIKRSRGKLELEPQWARTLRELDFRPMAVSSRHAEHVEHLPWHHHDPFDRLLVAQALLEDHSLVSADGRLAAYGVDVVW